MLTRKAQEEQARQIAIEKAILQVLDRSRTNGRPSYISQPDLLTQVREILGYELHETSLKRMLIKLVNQNNIGRANHRDVFFNPYH